MSVALKLYDNDEFAYEYEIVEDDNAYKVWKSTGPLSGRFINCGEKYDQLIDAMQALVDFIKGGE